MDESVPLAQRANESIRYERVTNDYCGSSRNSTPRLGTSQRPDAVASRNKRRYQSLTYITGAPGDENLPRGAGRR